MTIYEKLGAKREAQVPNKRQMEWYERERSIFFHFGMNTFTGKEWGDGSESPSLFNPTECDVDSWVEAISKAGFACAILTAKHHDGFCLWQTKYTEHSIKNSPYKNGKGDIVREFTDACKKYGVKAGIYLSPWDRHEPSWGTPDYNDYYANQLTELMSNYGEIWECWWDGAGSTEASYDWERWAGIVRTLQPNAVIFGSLGATPW
ncbi:MAG: alpha-L-fucosidase, partial [Clostridia bacterium]|nr:alpha-L-fucosidase [Clostridia bacterium]